MKRSKPTRASSSFSGLSATTGPTDTARLEVGSRVRAARTEDRRRPLLISHGSREGEGTGVQGLAFPSPRLPVLALVALSWIRLLAGTNAPQNDRETRMKGGVSSEISDFDFSTPIDGPQLGVPTLR